MAKTALPQVTMEKTALARVSKLAQLQMKMEDDLAQAEERVKLIKERLRGVAERDLPEAMEAVEIESFTLADGSKVSIKNTYVGSISKDHTGAAFAWLRENGHDGIIKHDVTLSFGKGDDADAKAALKLAKSKKWPTKDKESVHTMTLRGFIREQLEDGNPLPMDLFGAQRLTSAKIIRTAQ